MKALILLSYILIFGKWVCNGQEFKTWPLAGQRFDIPYVSMQSGVHLAYLAFDNNVHTFYSTGSDTYRADSGHAPYMSTAIINGFSGHRVEIDLGTNLMITNYTVTGALYDADNIPGSSLLFGKFTGITYYHSTYTGFHLLDRRDTIDWETSISRTGRAEETFVVANPFPARRFSYMVPKLRRAGPTNLSISEIRFFGYEVPILHLPTVAAANVIDVTCSKILNHFDNYPCWRAFDKSSTYWQSADAFSATTGLYTGSVTIETNGYPGEWVEIDLKKEFLPVSYSVTVRPLVYTRYSLYGLCPRDVRIYGKQHGSLKFVEIDRQVDIKYSTVPNTNNPYAVDFKISAGAHEVGYRYFRYLVGRIYPGERQFTEIPEIQYHGSLWTRPVIQGFEWPGSAVTSGVTVSSGRYMYHAFDKCIWPGQRDACASALFWESELSNWYSYLGTPNMVNIPHVTSGYKGEFIEIDLMQKVKLSHFIVTAADSISDRYYLIYAPIDYALFGRQDSSEEFVKLFQIEGSPVWFRGESRNHTLDNQTMSYRHLRLAISKTSGTIVSIGEIQYFGEAWIPPSSSSSSSSGSSSSSSSSKLYVFCV